MKTSTSSSMNEAIHHFLLLPSNILLILLLEFLNSFRSYGLRFILYNYITNEFNSINSDDATGSVTNISDKQAGIILGIKSIIDIIFGLCGSILVDSIGIRHISLLALSIALLSRAILAITRSTNLLYVTLFLLSPMGDALLSIGLYRVALKKLSTPKTRPMCFGLSYGVSNMAGVCVSFVVDYMRRHLSDVELNVVSVGVLDRVVGGVYTPIRQFIILTWIVLFITFLIAYLYLEDWTVIDVDDLDDEYCNNSGDNLSAKHSNLKATTLPLDTVPAEPMIGREVLQQWLFMDDDNTDEGYTDETTSLVVTDSNNLPTYRMYRTRHHTNLSDKEGDTTSTSASTATPCGGVLHIIKQFISLLYMRNTWMVLVFSFASVPVVLQWTASEMVLPPFLERRFGEVIPIYTIQSIHMIGCVILPPFAQAITGQMDDFRVMIPGLWIMAISPVFVALLPNVTGACIWQVFMTIGQVLWSPRQDSWTAGLAPTGMEGLFFAIGSSRALLAPLGDYLMGAMNEKYNPNCPTCRDSYGHFCFDAIVTNIEENNTQQLECWSIQERCSVLLENNTQTCPATCTECPSWEHTNPSTIWYILVGISITSPLLTWLFLPFLRGRHSR